MTLFKLLAYGLGTWFVVVKIFHFSTYHRYFWKALPVLIILAALDGWLFHRFGLSRFWLEFLVVFLIGMVFVGRNQKRQVVALMTLTDDPDQLRLMAQSGANTLTYFWLSLFLFCTAWFIAWVAAFNA